MISMCRDASAFVRKVICYNQGEYAQYNFLAGEFHKTLKDAWRESQGDVENLHKLCDQLKDFLNENLHRVSQHNFNLIKEYFHDRHAVPRICIKGNYERDGKRQIVQIVRDQKVNYLSQYPLDDNSGFLSVTTNGLHFICNDIPKSIADGKYRNARINAELARAYYKEKREPIDKKGVPVDESWIKCWVPPIHGALEPESCYKSTAIIPMTLWNNRLAPAFLAKMKIKAENAEPSRTIFGYLCFDHVEENYFKESHIDIGYIFADILSLYMITLYVYTTLSATFSDVTRSFSQQEVVAWV